MSIEKEMVAESYRRKGELLHLMSYPKEARIYEEVSKGNRTMEEGQFILDVTPEEYEKAVSKFARPGLRLSELGLPEWETPGRSIRFPFIIVEEGIDNGKENKLVAGVSKDATFKTKEILGAASVPTSTTAEGKVTFDKNAVVGKQIKVLYVKAVDTRKPEEGGTGTEYTKPTRAYPPDTTDESLGI